ncbi:UNVERIFIED_CONTAM: hypothetical protein HDU68_008502 [Siphonaria sp. JEL0065]|nr:hypothetical protein HDU68_008502 [Siphonaria sp. JEL0065]
MLFNAIVTAAAFASSVTAIRWKDGHGPNAINGASLAAGNNLNYGGGPLLANIVVKPLYWSNSVKFNYDAFYVASVTGTASSPSDFFALVTEYSTGSYTLGGGSSSAGITNASGASSGTVNVSAVESYIKSLVSNGSIDPSGGSLYVPVHFAAGVTINEDTGLGLGASCSSWCAYHYSVNTSRGWVYYGIHPEMSSGGCASGCGAGSAFANNCDVASHELAEATTDADQPQTGWINANGEIGDLCNGQASTFCGADGYQYTVQKQWSNRKGGCAAPPSNGQSCRNGVATGGKPVSTTTTTTKKSTTTTTTTIPGVSSTTSTTTKPVTTTTTTKPITATTTTTTVPTNNNSCYPAYSSTGIYISGSYVSSNGYNYVLSGTSWVKQGTCNSSLTQKCFAPYSSSGNYVKGSQVSYQGSDYTFDGTSWINQGVCA